MTSIGIVIVAVCFFLINFVFDDVFLFDKKKRDITDAIFGVILFIGCTLILAGVAIKLWEFMP